VLPEGTFNLMKIYIIVEKLSKVSKNPHFDEISCIFGDNSKKLVGEVFPDELP
jgi:hypothetical protein